MSYALAVSAVGRLDDALPRRQQEARLRSFLGRRGLDLSEEDDTDVPFLLPVARLTPDLDTGSGFLHLTAAFDTEAGVLAPARHLHEATLLGFSRADIRKALLRKPLHRVFAASDHPTEGPLAVVLQRLRGSDRIHVTLTAATTEAPTSRRRAVPFEPLPFWAAALELTLQARYGFGAPLTPAQVIEALDRPLAAIPLPAGAHVFTPAALRRAAPPLVAA